MTAIGAAQGLYLSISLFLEKRGNFKNVLISLFFLSITIRIIKSFLWVYLEETPLWLINTGFWAHTVSGPLLYLYTYYFILNKPWKWRSLLHFIPSLLLLMYLPILTLDNFWYLGGYSFMLVQQMLYALFSVLIIIIGFTSSKSGRAVSHLGREEQIWIVILVLGLLFLQLAYFSNYILGLTPYLLGPAFYAVIIYFLGFFALKNRRLLFDKKAQKKYRNINLSEAQIKDISDQIAKIMLSEKPFKEADYQLGDLSSRLRLPRYLVSYVINKVFFQNFSDYINTYRINEAKELLNDRKYRAVKIASIAFDCGFNSLSSFNHSFKRHTGMTPSSFRKSVLDL